MFHSLYLSANAGRSTTERRPACGRVSSHVRSYLVSRSLTSKESVVFLLRLRCNRLLRRQHCSSLCLQSEGHEHVANIASALGHIFVGFLAVFGRHNIRPPHFASKVSYSASPQTFAECSRSASLPTLIFWILNTHLYQKNRELPIGLHTKSPAALLDETRNAAGLIICLPPSAAAVLARRKEQRGNYVLLWPQGVAADEAISRFSAVYQNFTVPRLRSTSMPSWALRLNLPAFLALNLMVKSSWLPSSRRKLLPRLTKVG